MEDQGHESFAAFDVAYSMAAERAAQDLRRPSLATVTSSKASLKRWLAGEVVPRGDNAVVLEYWLGEPVTSLMQPAPHRVVLPRFPADAGRESARALNETYAGATLWPAGPIAGSGGVWLFGGRHLFDRAAVSVQFYAADRRRDALLVGRDDLPHLRSFIEPRRRALVLAVPGSADGEVYVLDAAEARRQLEVTVDRLPVPAAYRLDALTFALLWALCNLDGSLQDDDHVIAGEQETVDAFSHLARSAPGRSAVPALSRVGAAWMGMRHCAQHVLRHLRPSARSPLFWTRVRDAEHAAGWLFFASWPEYIATLGERFRAGSAGARRVVVLPDTAVEEADTHERILMFLTVALMEAHSVPTWVCGDADHSGRSAFVLQPDEQVVVADWQGEDHLWHTDALHARGDLHAYADVLQRAHDSALTVSESPRERLLALADHLELDWTWLTSRCRELADYGLSGLLRPRSHRLSVAAVHQALAFVGTLVQQPSQARESVTRDVRERSPA
ncbi:hypothetical protein [Streptomyces sp. VRA16 Mangrove soil]|uniref:hypothetical protein n=1 Tax=Streptomyces sp. VRA16 Mangrove soil TaxID=2817434 RepID=UPI001A9D1AB1|nr:hypothetical protein [Streptomyces sp. VRA16 Mangrove soil]MBO1329917.1 hypothetical protein [Streptomyces sp. VRA16 Mangrove soil]